MTVSVFNLENVHLHPLHESPEKNAPKSDATSPTACLYCDEASCEDEIDSQSSASTGDYDEYDEELGLGNDANDDGAPLRVSWAPEVVTDVRFRPRTSAEDKTTFFYTSADQQRFRQEYKMQIRAVQRMRREQYERSRQQQQQRVTEAQQEEPEEITSSTTSESSQHLLNNPLSGFINLMSTYLSRPSSPTQEQSNENQSTMSRISNLETAVLVDTLYLF